MGANFEGAGKNQSSQTKPQLGYSSHVNYMYFSCVEARRPRSVQSSSNVLRILLPLCLARPPLNIQQPSSHAPLSPHPPSAQSPTLLPARPHRHLNVPLHPMPHCSTTLWLAKPLRRPFASTAVMSVAAMSGLASITQGEGQK